MWGRYSAGRREATRDPHACERLVEGAGCPGPRRAASCLARVTRRPCTGATRATPSICPALARRREAFAPARVGTYPARRRGLRQRRILRGVQHELQVPGHVTRSPWSYERERRWTNTSPGAFPDTAALRRLASVLPPEHRMDNPMFLVKTESTYLIGQGSSSPERRSDGRWRLSGPAGGHRVARAVRSCGRLEKSRWRPRRGRAGWVLVAGQAWKGVDFQRRSRRQRESSPRRASSVRWLGRRGQFLRAGRQSRVGRTGPCPDGMLRGWVVHSPHCTSRSLRDASPSRTG